MSTSPLVDTVRLAAGDLAADISDARKLRLLCPPQGHFIINLAVIYLRDGLVLACPLDGVTDPAFAAELVEIAANANLKPPRGTGGWIRESANRIGVWGRAELDVECPNRRCRYSGSFEYYSFAAELGAVAQRHTEHRLTH